MGVIKFEIRYVKVDKGHDGEKLFQFLIRIVDKKVPKSAIMKWIRTGQVRVNGRRVKPFVRIRKGEMVRIPPHYVDTDLIKENSTNPFDLTKVFENDDFLVLEKPPELCVQPGKGVKDSVYDRLKQVYGNNFYLVHRLDKETSGLLLVAKSYHYLRHLQKLWMKNRINKFYLAWIDSFVFWPEWTLVEDVLEDRNRRVKAQLYVKTIGAHNRFSLIAVKLITGKKHQIRIQMAKRNTPIVGDRKYSKRGSPQGLLLHACGLAWDEFFFWSSPKWSAPFEVEVEKAKESILNFKKSLP